jgi:hypothetical protein
MFHSVFELLWCQLQGSYSPLCIAVQDRRVDIARQLIAAGADVNLQSGNVCLEVLLTFLFLVPGNSDGV